MEKSITIEGLTKHQVKLANLLWRCENDAQVAAVLALFGAEARYVKELMIAATLDLQDGTEIAEQVLAQFRL